MIPFRNPFLQLYTEYTEKTEPQVIFNIWAGLSGVSASLGRRVALPFGIDNIYPNTYIVFVGPPASRKSTAILWMLNRLKASTKVRFAPDDTAGQRQGLIKKFIEETQDDQDLNELNAALDALATGATDDVDLSKIKMHVHPKDKHVLYAVADEFDSLIGVNARELTTFLIKCWNASDYDYSTSSQQKVIKDPLLSILAGTTSATLAECLPNTSVGSGFSSRIIFVFASKRREGEYPPPPPDKALAKEVENVYGHLFYKTEGDMKMTKAAWDLSNDLYRNDLSLDDPRFVYYCNRRHIHHLKISMLLAAARISYTITPDDVAEANAILVATEQFMPDALGEFGLSPAGAARQKLVEFMQYIEKPVSLSALRKTLKNDVKSDFDFVKAVDDLLTTGKIEKITHASKGDLYILKRKIVDIEKLISELHVSDKMASVTRLDDIRAASAASAASGGRMEG